MTLSLAVTQPAPPAGDNAQYQPGVCNIGPAEIARRRRAGHVGAAAAVGLLAVLVVVDAPSITRLLIALPAAVSASGYLQAHFRFCVGFASLGEFNFGELGEQQHVADAQARARDRARGLQLGLAASLIGLAVGVAAVLLPV